MPENQQGKFLTRLKAELLPHLAGENTLLLAGFSGGRDSLALLYGLHLLSKGELAGRYRLVAAHLNHNLRGAEAAADAEFCRDFCAGRGIELVTATAELSPDMPNLEQRARAARYGWFAGLRRQYLAAGFRPFLLTAHHLEDQAETVLLHLLRGSGTAGLAAMRQQSGWHLRPLLACPRAEITGFVTAAGLSWREDSTNAELDHTRNLLRAKVMPRLREINPRLDSALAQTAALAQADEEHLQAVAARKMAQAELSPGQAAYAWAALQSEPLAIRRRLVRALWLAASGEAVCPLTYDQVEAVLKLRPGQSLHLSGAVRAARRGKSLRFTMPSAAELAARRAKSRGGQVKTRR